jgi:murein DD-endopeptidase MepM/ murein hydrolase activator NlpD
MFRKHGRGLLDLVMTVLCLWVAGYHTPAGALVRRFGAWVLGARTNAPPLLAYYGGSGDLVSEAGKVRLPPSLLQLTRAVPEGTALGYGAYASLMELPPAHRAAARELATRYGADPGRLEHPTHGPLELAKVIKAARADLGSDDAAVLAVMCGYEPARFARERSEAEGGAPDLARLLRQLPPSFEGRATLAANALALGTAFGLAWPVHESARVSSPFGVRVHPILGRRKMHTGVDLSVPVGTPVKVVAAGTVRRASEDAVNGRVLVIDHGRGVTTAYCHNSELLVTPGTVVQAGQVIARSGSTGRATGPHLHYQLELAGEPVDPFRFRPLRVDVAEGGGVDGRRPPARKGLLQRAR